MNTRRKTTTNITNALKEGSQKPSLRQNECAGVPDAVRHTANDHRGNGSIGYLPGVRRGGRTFVPGLASAAHCGSSGWVHTMRSRFAYEVERPEQHTISRTALQPAAQSKHQRKSSGCSLGWELANLMWLLCDTHKTSRVLHVDATHADPNTRNKHTNEN